MEAVFGEIHEGYVAHVCEQLNSIEAQSARDLSAEAQSLFDGSRTAKQRDAAGRRLLKPLTPVVRHYGTMEVRRPKTGSVPLVKQ